VIIGTGRQGRFSEKPAAWVMDRLALFATLDERLGALVTDLLWWANALAAARAAPRSESADR
jgi:hypothetical protein